MSCDKSQSQCVMPGAVFVNASTACTDAVPGGTARQISIPRASKGCVPVRTTKSAYEPSSRDNTKVIVAASDAMPSVIVAGAAARMAVRRVFSANAYSSGVWSARGASMATTTRLVCASAVAGGLASASAVRNRPGRPPRLSMSATASDAAASAPVATRTSTSIASSSAGSEAAWAGATAITTQVAHAAPCAAARGTNTEPSRATVSRADTGNSATAYNGRLVMVLFRS
jgi:hypothetical protein